MTEEPARFLQALEGRRVDFSGKGQSARTLKGFDVRDRLGVKDVIGRPSGRKVERGETVFELAHTRTRVAKAQRI